MPKITLVRYGEIALKSRYVRSKLESRLIQNIYSSMKAAKLSYKIRKDYGRIFVLGNSRKLEKILEKTFGVVSFSPAVSIATDIEKIREESVKLAKSFKGTFAARVNRIGNHTFSSKDLEKEVGSAIVEKYKLKVNLSKPDNILSADIRGDKAYLYTKTKRGHGGMPLATQGNVLSIIITEGDLIAAWLFMKRGCNVFFVFPKKGMDKLKNALNEWKIGSSNILESQGADEKFLAQLVKKRKIKAIVKGYSFEEIEKNPKTLFGLPVYSPIVGFSNKELSFLKEKIGI